MTIPFPSQRVVEAIKRLVELGVPKDLDGANPSGSASFFERNLGVAQAEEFDVSTVSTVTKGYEELYSPVSGP